MPDQVEEAQAALAAGQPVEPGERRYLVYRRAQEPCRVCGARVHTQVVAGRNLFWCGRCQRRR
jgi:endonuclease-8